MTDKRFNKTEQLPIPYIRVHNTLEIGMDSGDRDNFDVVDCPVFWNLTNKCETYVALSKKKIKHKLDKIDYILRRIENDDLCNDILFDELHDAFCYTFRYGLVSYYDKFLKMWPETEIYLELPIDLEDFINRSNIGEELVFNAMNLIHSFVNLLNFNKLKHLRILNFSQLPVFFKKNAVGHFALATTDWQENNCDEVPDYSMIVLNVSFKSLNCYDAIEQFTRRFLGANVILKLASVRIDNTDASMAKMDLNQNTLNFGIKLIQNSEDGRGSPEVCQPVFKILKTKDSRNAKLLEVKTVRGFQFGYTTFSDFRCLDLGNNNLYNKLYSYIEYCPYLTSLRLNNCVLSVTDLEHLCLSSHTRSLVHLDLSENDFGKKKFLQMFFILLSEVIFNLETLTLVNINVNSEEVHEIVKVVRSCKSLRFINVSLNPGGNDFLRSVLENLPGIRAFIGTFNAPEGSTASYESITFLVLILLVLPDFVWGIHGAENSDKEEKYAFYELLERECDANPRYDMKIMLEHFGAATRDLLRHNLAKTVESEGDKGDDATYAVLLDTLEKRLTKFQDLQEKVENLYDDTIPDDVKLRKADVDKAVQYLAKIDLLRIDVSKIRKRIQDGVTATITKVSTASISSNITSVRLPIIELTKFDGDVTKWQSFWDKFVALVDKSNTYDGYNDNGC
ncbi:Leucine-rich repeat-containing protein 14 [Nymphon striatum]|nr:Leucine-rich repeat-containing protein 14 [Nymphon striatum]